MSLKSRSKIKPSEALLHKLDEITEYEGVYQSKKEAIIEIPTFETEKENIKKPNSNTPVLVITIIGIVALFGVGGWIYIALS